MNGTKIQKLLKQWSVLIDHGEYMSRIKAEKNTDGLMGRIKRTKGPPIVFDLETHEHQKEIQKSIRKELPQWSDIIFSEPEIMHGYSWTRNDFIELYFEHFRMVVEKLQRIIDKQTIV